MFSESVSKQLKFDNLESQADILESSGLMNELIILIRKSKSVSKSLTPDSFTQIFKILVNEVWKGSKKTSSLFSIDSFYCFETPSTISPKNSNFINFNQNKNLSSDLQTSLSFRKKLALNNEKHSFFYGSRSSFSYKMPVSSEVAYMVL